MRDYLTQSMEFGDKQLIERLKLKEEKAWKWVYKEYYNTLFTFASHYLYDEDAAKDIVQELFIHLYEKSNEININTSFKHYLIVATKNRCINFLKSLKITDSHKQHLLEAHVVSDTLDTLDTSENHSLIEDLSSVIETLPPKVKEVFFLRIKKDLRFREIALKLGITENNAKVQMNKAIKILKEKISLVNIFFFPLMIGKILFLYFF